MGTNHLNMEQAHTTICHYPKTRKEQEAYNNKKIPTEKDTMKITTYLLSTCINIIMTIYQNCILKVMSVAILSVQLNQAHASF